MPSHHDRGSAFVADLALASFVVLVVASTITAAGIVADAVQSSREAARTAAVVAARSGDTAAAERAASALAPRGATVTVEVAGDVARARVSARMRLPHPVLRAVHLSISETVEVPVAPYRSNRG